MLLVSLEIAWALLIAYLALLLIPPISGRWLVYWHGEGEPHQYQFYRCHGCRRIVTHRHIRLGGCACHETSKISPAKLTATEKVRLLYAPWSVTSRKVRRLTPAQVRAEGAR